MPDTVTRHGEHRIFNVPPPRDKDGERYDDDMMKTNGRAQRFSRVIKNEPWLRHSLLLTTQLTIF